MHYVKTTVEGWYSTENRSLYIHEDTSTIVRWMNPKANCRNCIKRYTVEHPNKSFQTKVIKASGNIHVAKLDRHITSMAMTIIKKGVDIENITAPPSKMCIDCMELVSLTTTCQCGNTMEDKQGRVFINIAQFELKDKILSCYLNMHGYQPIKLYIRIEYIKPSDVLRLKTSQKQIEAIHVNGRVIREQIVNYRQELTDK